MTSKLFHTVVGVGIALGAMTVGCAADPSTDSSSSAAADTTTSTDQTQPADGKTGNDQDRYCTGAWPTTKRGGQVAKAQSCIDPKNECGAYPGGAVFSWDFCAKADAQNVCSDDEKTDVWKICKDTGAGPQWQCPTGFIETKSCVAPANDGNSGNTTTAPNQAQN